MFLPCHVRISEWIHTLWLPECQGTLCLKQAQNGWVWPNGWVFVHELSGSGFESSYSHLNNLLFKNKMLLRILYWKEHKYVLINVICKEI